MTADYKVYVDWDGDQGQTALGSFEGLVGTDNWSPGGSVPPAIARSTTRSHHGDASLLVTWGAGGTLPLIGHIRFIQLVSGVQYTLRAWVWVPTGSPNVLLTVAALGTFGTASSTNDAWEQISFTFTAPEAYNTFQLWPETSPSAGNQVWFDEPTISTVHEDVSALQRVDLRSPLTIRYGRDQSRSLSPIAPGEMNFALYNTSRDYSPENASSPLAGNILPARPVVSKATLGSKSYTLFCGDTDNYTVLPNYEQRSVELSAVDALAKLKGVTLSTGLYQGIRTGEAIHVILDEVGWPLEAREIDVGATVIRWWWEEGTEAFTALEKLVSSEGPAALATVSGDRRFIFRDRHHRLTRTESTTSQATFRDAGTEPVLTAPLKYDHGWRDIINSVTVSVERREPNADLQDVFTWDETVTVAAGQTYLLKAESTDPFFGAVVPEADIDYTVMSGAVEVTLSRTAGQSTTVFIKATVAAVVRGMRVRAYPVQVVSTVQVHAERGTSIAKYERRSAPVTAPWAWIHDAAAICDVILAQRAEPLPIVSAKFVSANDTRLTQQLSRDLSDRVTVVDAETGLNDDFYLEQIEHTISEGLVHETVFGCEKVATQPTDVFILGSATRGVLGTNRLGTTGLDDPATLFILGSATRGVLGTNLLGH